MPSANYKSEILENTLAIGVMLALEKRKEPVMSGVLPQYVGKKSAGTTIERVSEFEEAGLVRKVQEEKKPFRKFVELTDRGHVVSPSICGRSRTFLRRDERKCREKIMTVPPEVLQAAPPAWPLELPDPGNDVAKFLGWVKRRGLYHPLDLCEVKWKQMGHREDLNDVLDPYSPGLVRIGREQHGTLSVKVIDRAWADNWASHYGVETFHHGQQARSGKATKNLIKK